MSLIAWLALAAPLVRPGVPAAPFGASSPSKPRAAIASSQDPDPPLADPYVLIGGALPVDAWEAAQGYVGQGLRGGPLEGAEPIRPPSFVPAGASPLAAQRATVRQWATVFDALRQASDQPYRFAMARKDEELWKIKNLAKFVGWGAHVRFAEGDRRGAVTILLDGLKMARRIRAGSTLDALVGSACESLVMASFEEHLNLIPLAECDRVRKSADVYLTAPMVVPMDASANVRSAMADDPARWILPGSDTALTAFAKTLTQLRLLRLHMRVEAYRWNYQKLPTRLVDAAPEGETEDPLTQAAYRYEPSGTTYKITSSGFKGQGPMGLRYRRDPNLTTEDETSTGGKP